MANVAFKKGLLSALPAEKTPGMIYVTTDERAMYIDIDASTRIRLGDFQEFATVAALEANTNPSTTALYYVSAINCLAKWDGTKYVQINLDTGATSIEVVGNGNAVTAATYDAATRKITLTKGETFATQAALNLVLDGESIDSFADVESALAGKQDTIPENTYDEYGAAATAKSEVIGASTDASSADTIFGAKKKAEEEAAAVLGDNSDSAGDATVYGANKAAAAAQAEAEAKVASVSATANKGIEIGGTATAPTVGIKLAETDNDLSFDANGALKYKAAAAAEYAIAQQATAETGYAATYILTKDGTQAGAKINIPKDFLVKSATLETVDTADTPYSGAAVGDKYIDFVINAKDASETAEHLYLPVNDLVDVYTSGSQAGDMVVIAVDPSTNKITATITDGTITLAKLASAVQTEINKAHEHSNKALLDTYTQTEADLADAVTKKHAHANAAELDLFETGDKSKLDTAASKAAANETAIGNIKDGEDLDSFGDVEDALDLKAPLASPALTGTPTAPTAAAGTNDTQIATTAFVKNAIDSGLEWGSF